MLAVRAPSGSTEPSSSLSLVDGEMLVIIYCCRQCIRQVRTFRSKCLLVTAWAMFVVFGQEPVHAGARPGSLILEVNWMGQMISQIFFVWFSLVGYQY